MSFGGSVAAMIASLKANKRNRVSTFDKIKGHKKSEKSELHFDKKATPYELEQLKKRLIAENNTIFKRKVLILVVMITAILIALNYIE
ncbi:hypothetical protein QWY81_14040 [Polaribacter undariae]|uniref:Uncharacterized protein n=1 Tax=Polaribacter sejongensis TaxID=985043 RepID=A0AAJ1QZP0_9FLAO|nr:hypothetical protein [Polaribacter undariae]MDN3620581.1 hypothetical protein [Polaribacter undariae]UWD31217.1 hypothetical protein NQP51_13855 [Polaribacter undariae]